MDDEHCRFIFNKIAIALHKLHSNGVAHRDIKPENIILTPDFKIKIIDFGFGIPLSGKDGSFFMNTPRGTPTYRAPEIMYNKQYQGSDVDIFAFGVMVLTLRTMTYPFKHAYSKDEKYRSLMSNDSSRFWQ